MKFQYRTHNFSCVYFGICYPMIVFCDCDDGDDYDDYSDNDCESEDGDDSGIENGNR